MAIAISLVPPLAVVGLTLESGAPRQALGSLLLFVTNVIAILASGIVVMGLYRVRRTSAGAPVAGDVPSSATTRATTDRHPGVVLLVGVLLLAVSVPLWINSQHFDQSSIRVTGVQTVADRWAASAGWDVLGVTEVGQKILIDTTGPSPAPSLAELRRELDAAGLQGVDVLVESLAGRYAPLPAQGTTGLPAQGTAGLPARNASAGDPGVRQS